MVTGDLNAGTANGAAMVFSLHQTPARGSVVLGPDGSCTYAPDAGLASTGGSDIFRVTIDNGGPYRLTGIIGAIQGIVSSLAQLAGLRQPDTVTAAAAARTAAAGRRFVVERVAAVSSRRAPLRSPHVRPG